MALEVICCPMTDPLTCGISIFSWMLFDWLGGFRLLFGRWGFYDDISIELLVQARFICRLWCCVLLYVSAYHIAGVVKHHAKWIVHKVMFCGCLVPTDCTQKCAVIRQLLILHWMYMKAKHSTAQKCFKDEFDLEICQVMYSVPQTKEYVAVWYFQ